MNIIEMGELISREKNEFGTEEVNREGEIIQREERRVRNVRSK